MGETEPVWVMFFFAQNLIAACARNVQHCQMDNPMETDIIACCGVLVPGMKQIPEQQGPEHLWAQPVSFYRVSHRILAFNPMQNENKVFSKSVIPVWY